MARRSPRRAVPAPRRRASAVQVPDERRFRALIEHSADAITLTRADGVFIYASPATRAVLGYEPADLTGRSAFDLAHPDDLAEARTQFDDLVRQDGARILVECRARHKDGSWRWMESACTNLLAAWDVGAVVMTYRDISPRRTADADLRQAHEHLKRWAVDLEAANRELALLRELGELLTICQTRDEASRVISRLLAQLFPGWTGALYMQSASGALFEAMAAWGDAPAGEAVITVDDCWALRRGVAHVAYGHASDLVCRHAGDAGAASACMPLIGPGGAQGVLHLRAGAAVAAGDLDLDLARTATGRIALALDNIQLRAILRMQSIRDPLTGLFNRRHMEESLERELRRADRLGLPVAVIAIDLDRFKHINDTLGHPAGDTMLAAFGAFLNTHVRREDIACRYGGEEFVLILPGAGGGAATARAEQLREACRQVTASYRGTTLGPLTMSMGVAVHPEHGTSGEILLREADRALYLAKQRGRDQVEFAAAD